MPPLVCGVRRLSLLSRSVYRSPCRPPPNRVSRRTISAAMPSPTAFSTKTSPSPVSASGTTSSATITAAIDNLLRRTANPMTAPMNRMTRFQAFMRTSFYSWPRPAFEARGLLRSVALTCAYPCSTDAIERGCVEKAPTATGELPDGVRGKCAQFDLGSGGELREPRRGNANRLRGDCRRKVLWEVDAVRPGSVVVDLGSRVERSANGPRRLYRRPARVNGEPSSRPLHDRAAGMRNRTKRREHSDRSLPRTRYGGVPAFDSGSGEQGSIHRPHHAAGRRFSLLGQPFGEQRSILGGRSRARDEPSSFLGTKHWKKPETDLSIVEQPSGWKAFGACPPRSLTPMRQRCDRG